MVLLTLLVVAIFSLGKIAGYCYHSNENQNNIRKLILDDDSKGENYRRLKEQNPDLVGWIRIPRTPVDYPVMWTPDEPEKYLRTDFNGNYSLSGLPFASADCNVSPMPDDKAYSNTLIYGHHMQDGSMFAVLTEYEKQDFYEEHRTIEFDRIFDDGSYEEYTYEIFSAFKTEIGKGFEYYRYVDIDNANRLNEYLENIEALRLIASDRTTDDVSELMTLSTCSYHVAEKMGDLLLQLLYNKAKRRFLSSLHLCLN